RRALRMAFTAFLAIVAIWLFARSGRSKDSRLGTQPAVRGVLPDSEKPSLLQSSRQTVSPDPPPAADYALDELAIRMPHVVARGESAASLAWRFLPVTVYQRRSILENAILHANALKGNTLQPGENIVIPGVFAHAVLDKPVALPRDFDARAIYLTGWTAGSERGLELIRKWRAVGGNAVVFDIKDYDGDIRVPFDHPYAPHKGVTIRNLPKFIHWLHSLHMHVIARIALFRDAHLAQTYPQFDIRSRKTGKPWLENGKLAWVDPSLPEVQQYDLDLAKMVVNDGADEIQLDYVRFPAEGEQADAKFAYQKDHPDRLRSQIIADFVGRAYRELHPKGALVSLDVFGVMAWARPADLRLTGQNITELARHCDVISPMIYPSHFFHFDGYTDPGDAPEHFISESMRRFQETTKGSGVVLRPWLQAFAWRTKTYSTDYVRTEIRVAAQSGGTGFLFWNADNSYPKPIAVMAQMHSAGGQSFRGELMRPSQAAGSGEASSAPPGSNISQPKGVIKNLKTDIPAGRTP
ncbi:MAG: putative glycoside hydrolase, partial [Terriglobia bacterium]